MLGNSKKSDGLSEEQQEQMQVAVEEKADASKNFFRSLLSARGFSSQRAVREIPFVCFLAALALIYIANRHVAEDYVRDMEKLNKEVKSLSWEYKSLKADLMLKSTLNQVSKKVDTLGLKVLTVPPQKIVMTKTEGK
jgi:hypothetical protein